MNPIVQALLNISNGAQWTLRGDTYADLEWHDEAMPKPTEEEVNQAVADLPRIESQKQQKQASAKESALAKLASLGLTQDEVKALIG